ncbi:MAG: transposase [Chitinispirillaceae bacterium]
MARANRHHLPGYVWHITHRCHKKEFLLKHSLDKKRWRAWLFEAKKRYGLCVLNYTIMSNHVHLIAAETHQNTVSRSMQLVEGQTAQEYNNRKTRLGAFWSDRYQGTAVDTKRHLLHCLLYVDFNPVRARLCSHPAQYGFSGLQEIISPPRRYSIIDRNALARCCGFQEWEKFRDAYLEKIETAVQTTADQDDLCIKKRDPRWTESIAVGSERFIERFQGDLGDRSGKRSISVFEDFNVLREPSSGVYNESPNRLRGDNFYYWDNADSQ